MTDFEVFIDEAVCADDLLIGSQVSGTIIDGNDDEDTPPPAPNSGVQNSTDLQDLFG